MRRRWISLALVVVAAGVIGLLVLRRHDTHARPRLVHGRRLDVDAFRAELATRLRRANELAARRGDEPAPPPRRGRAWERFGTGHTSTVIKSLIEPRCVLGPHELCVALGALVRGCEDGDARDCIAVGQYLEDVPPRGIVAVAFFLQACWIGDPAGCERIDELQAATTASCDTDPFACGYVAMHAQDLELHDRACSVGVADSCSMVSWMLRDDPEQARVYLEAACQLGLSMACAAIGHALQPGCVENDVQPCYDSDPAQAKAALEIACAAGWGSAGDCR